MSSVDTNKWQQLSFDFGEEPEEAHAYFIVEAYLKLLNRIGCDAIHKIMKDVTAS